MMLLNHYLMGLHGIRLNVHVARHLSTIERQALDKGQMIPPQISGRPDFADEDSTWSPKQNRVDVLDEDPPEEDGIGAVRSAHLSRVIDPSGRATSQAELETLDAEGEGGFWEGDDSEPEEEEDEDAPVCQQCFDEADTFAHQGSHPKWHVACHGMFTLWGLYCECHD